MPRLGAIAVVLAALALALPSFSKAGALRGEVSYREPVTLPAEAILEVTLLDVTRADRPGELITSIQMRPKQPLPISFELYFGDGEIDPRGSYAVRASITAHGRLILITASTPRVLTLGHPSHVHIPLTAVSLRALGLGPSGLIQHTWLAREIKGRPALDGVRVTIAISESGELTGTGGCNHLRGTAQFDGQSLAFDAVTATRRMCEAATMRQEEEFLHALDLTRQLEIDGATLSLIAVDGAKVSSLVRVP
jgi:putative lipoprotein